MLPPNDISISTPLPFAACAPTDRDSTRPALDSRGLDSEPLAHHANAFGTRIARHGCPGSERCRRPRLCQGTSTPPRLHLLISRFPDANAASPRACRVVIRESMTLHRWNEHPVPGMRDSELTTLLAIDQCLRMTPTRRSSPRTRCTRRARTTHRHCSR